MKRLPALHRAVAVGRRQGRAPRLAAIGLVSALLVAQPALAADPDLARAGQLARDGRYQEAYDCSCPSRPPARATPHSMRCSARPR